MNAGEGDPPTALVVNCAVGGTAFELGRCFSLVLGVDSRSDLLEAARVRHDALIQVLPTSEHGVGDTTVLAGAAAPV